MLDGREDRGTVLLDALLHLHKGRDTAAAGPTDPLDQLGKRIGVAFATQLAPTTVPILVRPEVSSMTYDHDWPLAFSENSHYRPIFDFFTSHPLRVADHVARNLSHGLGGNLIDCNPMHSVQPGVKDPQVRDLLELFRGLRSIGTEIHV